MATLLNWLQTTTADFVAGTCGSQILDTSGDELKLLPQDTMAQFALGTHTNTFYGDDRNDENIRVQLRGIPNRWFNSDYNIATWDWTGQADPDWDWLIHNTPESVTISWDCIICDGITDNILATISLAVPPDDGAYHDITICDTTPYINRLVTITFLGKVNGVEVGKIKSKFPILLKPANFIIKARQEHTSIYRFLWIAYFVGTDQDCELTGNFLSQTLDFANAPVDFGHLVYKGTVPTDTTLTFKTQSSANGIDWDAEVALGAGGTIDSTEKRYLRWKAYFTRTDDGKAIPYLESVYCGGMEWYSAKYNIGRLDSYQTFLSTYNKYTETLIISYRTARSSAELDTATWYLIDNNEVPVNGLKGLDIWIQLKVRFNTDTFANQPVLYDTKIQWYDMKDIGLRYGKNSITYPIGCLDDISGCKLRIRKNDVTNGVVLVDTTDPKASPIRIYINGQTKALAKYS